MLTVSKQQESTSAYLPYTDDSGNLVTPSIVNPYVTLTSSGALDYRVEKTSISINELHMEAVIDKGSSSSFGGGNSATIKIFNLSESSRSFITQENNNVILKAGYNPTNKDNPDLNIIFTGQVDSYSVERKGVNTVTTLYCKDGHTPAKTIRVGLSLKPATPPLASPTYGDVLEFIKTVWAANGIKSSKYTVVTDGVSPPYASPDSIQLTGGYYFHGYLRDLCKEVAEEIGYKWYIDNSILYFEPKNTDTSITRKIYELNDSIILSLNDNKKTTTGISTSSDKDTGIVLETLLDNRFEVGHYVRVTEGDKKGDYLISDINYNLSYYGSEWGMKVTARKGSS